MASAWSRQSLRLMLLLLAFGLLMYNAQAQSPTMDEQNHMARGYALLRTGDPRLSLEHPPLINLLEAVPLGGEIALPLDDPSWEMAEWYRFADLFLWHVNTEPARMVYLSRVPVVALTLLLGTLMSKWGRMLAGEGASLLAMVLVLLDPNVLAHGSLATTDLGITFTVLLTAYTVWRAAERRTVPRVLAAGMATGAMLASKMSAVAFWASFGLLFVVLAALNVRDGSRVRRMVVRAGIYLVITAIGLLMLWACYGWQLAPVADGGVRVPMGTYWRGLGAVFENVQGARPSYFLGETRLGGWPAYFPVAFAVKTPLPMLVLLVVAAWWAWSSRGGPARDDHVALFLLLPVGVYWASVLVSDLNLGYRHLLPTLPLLYVWAATTLSGLEAKRWQRLMTGALVWIALEAILIAPHFLAYFNPVAGGPRNGWRVLADSNIDWGQDLQLLSDYLVETASDETVRLSWFGSAYPERYGIAYEPLPGLPHHFDLWFQPATFEEASPGPGVYAISVSNLVELPLSDKRFFAAFRAREPDARLGYSIYVYRVSAGPADNLGDGGGQSQVSLLD